MIKLLREIEALKLAQLREGSLETALEAHLSKLEERLMILREREYRIERENIFKIVNK